MSKHQGTLHKIDNTGTKWYRKVVNTGATNISAGQVVQWAYYPLTAKYQMSADYNAVRLMSANKYGLGQDSGSVPLAIACVAGVAIEDIPKYDVTRTVKTDGTVDLNANAGSGTGWIQYRGAALVCTELTVTASLWVIPASTPGAVMLPETIHVSAGSGVIGQCLETQTGDSMTWINLTLV